MRKFTLPIKFSSKEVLDDGRFIKVTIDVLHTGENFNESVFEKSVVDANAETIYNTPIIGFIKTLSSGEKDFNGHDCIIEQTDDGGNVVKTLCSAYGVIPESCNYRWETKMCDDGEEREFFVVDALVWTKFSDAAEILISDLEKPHSMEVSEDDIEGYEDENGLFHFTKFSFDGCCILGDDVEPAMINSNIRVQFSLDSFVKEIKTRYSQFSQFQKEKENEDIQKTNKEGGIDKMPENKFQTVLEQFEDMANIVRDQEKITDDWGWEYSRYSLVDIQGDKAIVMDSKDHYNCYAFNFTVEGDKPVIDFESGVRQKITYSDYEDGETVKDNTVFDARIEDMNKNFSEKLEAVTNEKTEAETKFNDVTTEFETAKTEFETTKKEYEDIKSKYEVLATEKAEREKAETESQKEALFAKFESALGEDEDFQNIKADKDNMSVEDIENRCSVLFARKNLATKFSKKAENDAPATVGIMGSVEDSDDSHVEIERYGSFSVE